MADQKITQLTADTTPTSDDLVVTVNDPAGTPANRKVTLANLVLGLGGAWATWTPSWTNVSGGSTTYATYIQIGKIVFFRIKYTLAGAGVAGETGFSPPVTMHSGYAANGTLDGTGSFIDSGGAPYLGVLQVGSTTLINIRCVHTDGARGTVQAASSSNPFTFGNGDTLEAYGTYEAA